MGILKSDFIKVVALSITVLALTGCASAVIRSGGFEGLANQDQKNGKIFVYREASFAGGANQYDVLMDGALVGSLPNGSFFTVNAEPGKRIIKADTGPFGKGGSVDVEAGKTHCMKMTLNFCVSCKSADITPVSAEQCASEIKSLTKVVLK